jgi:hypothetical protein
MAKTITKGGRPLMLVGLTVTLGGASAPAAQRF